MKGLEDLGFQLKISKFLIFILLFISSLNANNILSQEKEKILKLTLEKVNIDSSKQKIDLINPINFSYKKNINMPSADPSKGIFPISKISTININQPIFKSGGIYHAIKYSNAYKKYQIIDNNLQRNILIKDATKLLYQLYQIDLNIKKQLLKIQNSKIDVIEKRGQVFQGILDLSFLNSAIITLNQNRLFQENQNLQKEDLVNKFNNLSSKPYETFNMPFFSIQNKQDLLKDNLYIKKAKQNIKSQDYLKDITLEKYLPTISLTHDFIKYHDQGVDSKTTGIRLTIPIDIRGYYDTQSAKIAYLKSKLEANIIKKEEENYINTKFRKINIIQNKINIQKQTIQNYKKLIEEITELHNSGLKTSDDVQILKNSKKIALLELEIFKIDKQIQLLEIYARTNQKY